MNKFFTGRFRIGWILITLAAINGLFWTVFRWSYENQYTHAQITVDYDDTRTLADAYRMSQSRLLRELKNVGVTSVAVYEQSLANLRDNGRIAVLPREEADQLYPDQAKPLPPSYRWIITASPQNQNLLPHLMEHLLVQSQRGTPPLLVALKGANIIAIPASRQLLTDAQMGFDQSQVAAVKKLGLGVTARISNPLNLDEKRLNSLLNEVEGIGAHVIISSEDEVLGYDSMIGKVAQEMRTRHLLFGNIEFSKQRGWDDMSRLTDGWLCRVHSVGGDEAAKAKTEMLVDRFARAVKERNIRVAYVRLIRQLKGEFVPAIGPPASPGHPLSMVQTKTALAQNIAFIQQISDELQTPPRPFGWLRPPLVMGTAAPFGDYPLAGLEKTFGSVRFAKMVRFLGALIAGLGTLGGALLLLQLVFDLSPRVERMWLILGGLATAGLAVSPGMGAKLLALAAGCLFPVIAMLWGGLPEIWRRDEEPGRRSAGVAKAFLTGCRVLLTSSLIMMIGPLLIITLLNQWKFFSGADKFLLPKATQILPLVLAGLAFGAEVFPHRVAMEGARAARTRLKSGVDNALSHPFTARVALLSVVLVVMGFVWIARTGNDSGMEISPVELKMRALLERLFITRPRTKEIFLGNPAMIFAVWFAWRRQWSAGVAAVVLATIGQADMLNSFCHMHTPIFYALLRTIHGVWLGAVVGGAALWAYVLAASRLRPGGGPALRRGGTALDVSSNGISHAPASATITGRGGAG